MSKIYLAFRGLSEAIDNSPKINRAIEMAKDKDILVFPDGHYPIQKTLMQINKGLRWEGAGQTELMTALPVPGIHLKTNQSQSDTFITGIDFVNHYGGADNTPEQHGIICNVILNMSYCKIKSYWGHGIVVSADIEHNGAGSNASFSKFEKLLIASNRRSGMYFQGGDANQCNSFAIDIRDNWGWGIEDGSFLGNQFFGCMAHNNGEGNYTATDINNRSTFFGCYSEGGSPPCRFYGQAMIFGGLWSGNVELYDNAQAFWNGKVGNN